MSILVYTESEGGTFKKIAFEAVSYAKGVADMMGTTVTALSINGGDTSVLGTYGASKVLEVSNNKLDQFNAEAVAHIIEQAAVKEGSKIFVLTASP